MFVLLFYVQLSYHIFRDALFISVHFSVPGYQRLLVTPEIITSIYCATRVSGHVILLASFGCIYTLWTGGRSMVARVAPTSSIVGL